MIKANKLTGTVTEEVDEKGLTKVGSKSILVTAETAELRQFFKNHIDGKLFDQPHSVYKQID